ncbi:hypothetical protein GCM10022284_51170 [Streptomyces hundungensis]
MPIFDSPVPSTPSRHPRLRPAPRTPPQHPGAHMKGFNDPTAPGVTPGQPGGVQRKHRGLPSAEAESAGRTVRSAHGRRPQPTIRPLSTMRLGAASTRTSARGSSA